MKKVCLLNLGHSNIRSVRGAFAAIDVETFVIEKIDGIEINAPLVLPGVGSFGDAMQRQREYTEHTRSEATASQQRGKKAKARQKRGKGEQKASQQRGKASQQRGKGKAKKSEAKRGKVIQDKGKQSTATQSNTNQSKLNNTKRSKAKRHEAKRSQRRVEPGWGGFALPPGKPACFIS